MKTQWFISRGDFSDRTALACKILVMKELLKELNGLARSVINVFITGERSSVWRQCVLRAVAIWQHTQLSTKWKEKTAISVVYPKKNVLNKSITPLQAQPSHKKTFPHV